MNYDNLSWPELIKVATDKGVYEKGMKKVEVLEKLKELPVEEAPKNDAPVETGQTQEKPQEKKDKDVGKAVEKVLESITEPNTSEGDGDNKSEDGSVVFEAIPDREGKIVPLEVSINDRLWEGNVITVEPKYVEQVRALLKGGHYLFSERK